MKNILTETEKKAVLVEVIENLSDRELVSLHNEWCYDNNNYDDEIIEMERFDEICDGMTPSEIANRIFYGDFDPNHEYFHDDGYGNFESTDCPTDWIYPGDIADIVREVVDRECAFENDEIQDEIDSWSDDEDEDEDEDDDEDEDEDEEEEDDEDEDEDEDETEEETYDE